MNRFQQHGLVEHTRYYSASVETYAEIIICHIQNKQIERFDENQISDF